MPRFSTCLGKSRYSKGKFRVGDEIIVKADGYDNRGRLNLSRKAALPKPEKKEDKEPKEEKKTTKKAKKEEEKVEKKTTRKKKTEE